MDKAQIGIMISIVAYLSVVVIIGVIYSKRTKNVGDFYLGGRKLGPLVTAMSAEASDMSSWLLMGLPGVAYLTGIADAGWTAIGLAFGTYVNWLVVAKRLRNYSEKIGAITVPDFFAKRYKDDSNILLGLSALVIIIFFVPYTASGFSACGKLFATLFGISYHKAMIISAIVIVAYTSLGGFNAASTTDFIQSVIMTVALIIVLVFGVSKAGGLGAVADNAKSLPGFLDMFNMHSVTADEKTGIISGGSSPYTVLTIFTTLAWGLGYFGMPHILLRFMAIEDAKKIKLSRRVASVWVVISMGIAVFIGVVGNALVKAGKISIDIISKLDKTTGTYNLDDTDKETVIIKIADLLSNQSFILALVAGIILAGILASTMSTADSQLLAASSSMSENIMGGLFKFKLSGTAQMVVARATLIVVSVIAVIIALNEESKVFEIVSFAWGGFGAAFGPAMLLALFWKKSNRYGAMAGMRTGVATIFIWKFVVRPMGGIWDIYELLPAFIIALVANVIVSLISRDTNDPEMVETFEEVKAMK
ncbi:MAG: sodium/proline symporter [Ruminococcaceae bacterium]|nr:sodium/proline symporter [Oscillospiraceae bacterium]